MTEELITEITEEQSLTPIQLIQKEVGDHPPLLVRTRVDVGLVPANIVLEVRHDVALAMIRQRIAEPVGDFNVTPDWTLYDDQIEDAGIAFLAQDRECHQ